MNNVYRLVDLEGRTHVGHASRLWLFIIDLKYRPGNYPKLLYRLQATGLEIERFDEVKIDEYGHIRVKVFWFGFEFPTYELLDDVLHGAHFYRSL